MKTKRWHIRIEFDWDAYELIDLNAVKIKIDKWLPSHWKNKEISVKEV